MKTPYEVLGVAPDADDKTIDVAFRHAAKSCHPDVNPENHAAERQFKLILAARDALKNPEWRALYRYLQFRRQHERRHWAITIASCVVSALVSGGLVAVLQQASQSEAAGDNRPPAVAVGGAQEIATLEERFPQTDATLPLREPEPVRGAPAQHDEPASTPAALAAEPEQAAGAEPEKAAGGEPAQDTEAASARVAVAAAPSSPARAPGPPVSPEPQNAAAEPHQTGTAASCAHARGTKPSELSARPCGQAPGHAQSQSAAKSAKSQTRNGTSASPPRVFSPIRRASTVPAKKPAPAPSRNPSRLVEAAKPTYAQPKECWIDSGTGRSLPCAAGGG